MTGGAGGDLKIAAAEGVDTFITGEGPHWTCALAEELGMNVFYGGHYADRDLRRQSASGGGTLQKVRPALGFSGPSDRPMMSRQKSRPCLWIGKGQRDAENRKDLPRQTMVTCTLLSMMPASMA